jgi:hypothetical protein
MRLARRILWVMMVMSMIGVSCRFFSGMAPSTTTEPQPPVDDRALKFEPADLPDAQKGVPYEVEVRVENVLTFVGEFTIVKGKLPTGLSLERVPSENATRITGVPQETGTFAFVLGAWCEGTNDPGQTGQKEYTIVVK